MHKYSIKFWFLQFVLLSATYATVVDFKVNENEIIEIPKLLREHPFDNPDGGAWKQGWPITLEPAEFAAPEEKLNVFVVPHSHNDPGWIKTYDDYFSQQVNSILTSALTALDQDERRSFIYAEISFFDKWWTANPDRHDLFKKILKSGRFEFVTGGWVMNDEAASYYPAIITQLTEGHEWLRRNLNYVPQSGWSIDPFGYSPTQAYLLSLSGFEHMLIQRVHYVLKKHLAKGKQLEFIWRQEWAKNDATDIFTHLMPFFSYDIPHTCGPEPAICAMFEFSKSSTAWGGRVEPITSANVAAKSAQLLDQYRKKSTLYQTKNVLAPLGDDFTYDGMDYVNKMFPNHQQIHDFLNKDEKSHVSIRFSNLTNYFESVAKSAKNKDVSFPVLKGDFFTYADREQDYWSGYFTSRAFFKGLDRLVETTVRTAEILHTIARITKPNQLEPIDKDTFTRIQDARRAIGLFQHHDGITGTAKPHVVNDYGNRLHTARWDMKEIIVKLTDIILGSPGVDSLLHIDEIKKKHSDIPERKVIVLDGNGVEPVVFFNPLNFERRQLVSVLVNNATLRVQDGDGAGVVVQVSPVWTDEYTFSNDVFEVFFEVDLPPMGFNTYFIHPYNAKIMNKRGARTQISEVFIKGNRKGADKFLNKDINYSPEPESFVLSNTFTTIKVDSETGLLTSFETLNTHVEMKLQEDIVEYDPEGGAYLFLPKEQAKSHARANVPTSIRIVKGPVFTEITTIRPIVTRTIRLYNSDNDLSAIPEVFHKVTLLNGNKEIAVRYSTDLPTEGEMYTDLNGLQYQKRKYRADKPIQFNYYPITSSAWIQSDKKRFSVHTRQAMGAASLSDGTLELMLDRILGQDDNRGLGEPVRDNLPLEIASLLMVENLPGTTAFGRELSPMATRASLMLNHPISVIHGQVAAEKPWRKQYYTNFYALKNSIFPTDMHFISLRPREPMEVSNEIALQTIRLTYDQAFSNQELKPTIEPYRWFFVARLVSLFEKTLTLLHDKQEWQKGQAIPASPRDIFSFIMKFEVIDPMDLDHNEPDEEEQKEEVPENTVLKGLDETKKDTPFMNRVVGESIENFNMAGNNPYGKPTTTTTKQKQVIDPKLPPEVREVMQQLQKVEAEKEELKAKLDTELYHSKSNRLVALSFVIFGLAAIVYLRKTRNIFYVFLFALLVNILVPVFLFLPESNHI